ncbi:anthranilate phosphoribosyltransferase [Halovivax asiaticus JCM 14624]|uniref:Anthranilate phosphoribosyltransferase n=1 Tax=Halovivax asiaticus JCM 14624 TaxID=1227490 RepID=M0BM51_9EURY|nr:anthranilate phosphoribosyltransferase [Halovivax asiaticus]ELZ11961.1 anthranilate phosphoribosyltransferase [Halovivax asiaticus JCM 14624]
MTDDWPLDRLMSEVVGSGPRSASDMRYDQAREAMERILTGDPDPVALGGFWTANRWKRNTPVELAGFLDAMRTVSVETAEPDADPVDIGANYDGKADTAPLGVASGVVAAAAGTPVAVHSADRLPTTYGVTARHVLDELGVRTDLEPAESAAMVDAVGFGFYYAPRFNPGVHALSERRAALGVRTFLNTIETLANPAAAAVHVGSFFHRPFAEKVVATLRESRTVDVDRVVMVQGQEGSDDVRAGTTRIAAWPDGQEGENPDGADDDAVDVFEIETASFGVEAGAEVTGADLAATAARVTRDVVSGARDGVVADAVALNAGVRIYARDDASTLSAAVERARGAVADGSAADVLTALQEFDPADW